MTPDDILIVRADANIEIGNGHLMRCMSIAQAWKEKGGRVIFCSCCDTPDLKNKIIAQHIEWTDIKSSHPKPGDLSFLIDLILRLKSEKTKTQTRIHLIIDGYHFTPEYQKKIKGTGIKTIVIDDYHHHNKYYADIIVNQNIGAEKIHYICSADTQMLLGTRYIMLRKEFRDFKSTLPTDVERLSRILVTMGGSDPNNVTATVIDALKTLSLEHMSVKIIVGPSNPHLSYLKEQIRRLNLEFEIHFNVDNMAPFMVWADAAITAGGSTCWELCRMEVPLLIITTAENQLALTAELNRHKAGINLGWHQDVTAKSICNALDQLVNKPKMRISMVKNASRLVDGKGIKRLIRHIRFGSVTFTPAIEKDARLLWNWVNDPEVRESAFNPESISWPDHKTWFQDLLVKTDAVQLIALDQYQSPIGQLRFNFKNTEALIDYSVDKKYRGIGLGKQIIKLGMIYIKKNHPGVTDLVAHVKKENKSSNRIFKALDFISSPEDESIHWCYKQI